MFTTSVDSIVKQFTKMQAQLDSLITSNAVVIEANHQTIDKIRDDNYAREIEIKRAKLIKHNINNIFNA
jgi:hypothetical protein